MQGSSRASFGAVREDFLGRVSAGDATATGQDLLTIAGVLADSASFRAALADSGETPQRRIELLGALLGDHVGAQALDIAGEALRRRWSSPRDLTDALEMLGAEALLMGAESEGRIDRVEEELFRFARTVEGSSELMSVLSNKHTATESKLAVVDTLTKGRTEPETSRLVRHAVAHPGGRRVEDALSALVERAGARREQLVADVRVAQPLQGDQAERLAAALTHIYGQKVVLQVTVDPAVRGGAVVKIGDEVVDGSLASRLADVRRMMHS
jgi:F-type H+-transporting ATPase subunit delta